MAVQLATDIGNTGLSADHWVLVRAVLHREGNGNDFRLSGTYQLWASAAAFAAGQGQIPHQRVSVSTGVITGNPNAGQMQAMLDAAAVDSAGPLAGGTVV